MTKTSKNVTQPPNKFSTDRQILLMRDTSIVFPELWMKIWVTGPDSDQRGFPEMFARAQCYKAESIEEADLVVFTGGSDVNPALYGGILDPSTFFDAERDEEDLETYSTCYEKGIPMFGVCRGAQFGHVMNGGEMYQDVDGHNADHLIVFTKVGDSGSVTSSSVHHQMCIENEWMDVLAHAFKSTRRVIEPGIASTGHSKDIEAFFYRETCFFGVQGHPEYPGYYSFSRWCLKQIQELVVNNPDIELTGGYYRMKPDVMAQRELQKNEIPANKGAM